MGRACGREARACKERARDRATPAQVEHKQDGRRIVAHKREHVDEFALPAEVPNRKRNVGVAYTYRLFHEIDAQRLDVVLVEGALDELDHQARLADLRVANHADLDHNFLPARR